MIVALCSQKGGVGKSTVAVNLAAEAVTRGLSVLLVDADPQATSRIWGTAAAGAAEIHGGKVPTVVAMGAEMHRPDQLPQLAARFELVLIDCPGRTDEVQRSALLVADLALLPCGPGACDVWALAASLSTVKAAQVLRPGLQAALVLNRVQKGTSLGTEARGVLAQTGFPMLRTTLHQRIVFQEAVSSGVAMRLYAPGSEAATEVAELLDEVLRLGGAPQAPAKAKAPDTASRPTERATPPAPRSGVRKSAAKTAAKAPARSRRKGAGS